MGGYCHAVIDSPEGELMYARDVIPVIDALEREIRELNDALNHVSSILTDVKQAIGD